MAIWESILNQLENYVPLLVTILVVLIAIVISNLLINRIRKLMLKRSKTKKQTSSIEILTRVVKLFVAIFIVVVGIFSYFGSLTGLGVGLGLFSAGLGWALQKPITSIAAWLMIVIKRPFEIGDRVIVGNVRGDVSEISPTRFYLQEIGGIVKGEENSGRIIIIPNSVLFDREIINYYGENEYVLAEVIATITYESNLDKAMEIGVESAKKLTQESMEATGKEPYVRTYFKPDGVSVQIRFMAPSVRFQETTSNLTQEIFKRFKEESDIRISYPHREIVNKKNLQ